MNTAGITAEYNPFHRGHEYMMHVMRGELGEDTAFVCVMSGSFVQRGDCAIFRASARAEAAVRCGADLVLELPLPWAIASAEAFASGAVELLGKTGVVTHLCFGSECGDINALQGLAHALRTPETDVLIRQYLLGGVSYAAARQSALERTAGDSAALIAEPNNILAVEYLKALAAGGWSMKPITVRRAGARHDGEGDGVFFSASELRRRCATGENISPLLPEGAAEVIAAEIAAGRGPVTTERLDMALVSRLRMLPQEAFDALPDASEGLGARLCAAAHNQPDWGSILAAAKTKRYALSRLRRMLLCACLGVRAGDGEGGIPYVRVLAMSERGRIVLRQMRGRSALPVITKPAQIKSLDEHARKIFEIECAAADLYCLSFASPEDRRAGSLWRSRPFVLRNDGVEA